MLCSKSQYCVGLSRQNKEGQVKTLAIDCYQMLIQQDSKTKLLHIYCISDT